MVLLTSNKMSCPFLAYFPYFEKMKVGLCDLHAVGVSVNPPLLTFECLNKSMKLGLYIMAPEPISVAYFINPSHQSMCLCVSLLGKGSVKFIPPFIARQRLSEHVPAATNTCNNRRIVGCVCLWVCVCIPLSLLGNNLVKTFPRQRTIILLQNLFLI
jgi:hypothetical protein